MAHDQNPTKTAGILVIGNEILSGKVHDTNSFYLAAELRSLGVNVQRITVIPDEIEIIGKEVALFSQSYDYVFTSGGVGPTHDDVTMAGIAQGFGIKLITHPKLESRFRLRYGDSMNDAVMKMAEVPEGTEIVDLGGSRFPLVCFRNIFIFPGIPEYLREKFSIIRENFRCPIFYLKRIFLNTEESDIAVILNAAALDNSDVAFGSYPVLGNAEYKIMITAESKSAPALKEAVERLLKKLPAGVVTRIE